MSAVEIEEKEFTVTASTNITATFTVYAEDEDDARDQVENALVTGKHNFDFGVDVPQGESVEDDGWSVSDVAEKGT